MLFQCPKCDSACLIKAGKVLGKQRFKCKDCGYFCTVHKRGKAMHIKRQAIYLYLEGKGYRAIGRELGVSNVSVLKWVRNYVDNASELRNERNYVDKINIHEVTEFIKKRSSLINNGWLLIGIDDKNSVTCRITDLKS